MENPNNTPILTSRPFYTIIPSLITVLQHAQSAEGVATPQAKQALLQATNDLKGTLKQAQDYATTLPGGELNFQEQDDLITMLERLKDHKWQELVYFAHKVTSISRDANSVKAEDVIMDVDSTASTPFGS